MQRHCDPDPAASEPHLELGQIKRVEHQLNPLAGELGVDLVVVAVDPERPGLRHRPLLRPQKRFAQHRLRRRCRHRPGGVEALQWRLSGLRMRGPVIDRLHPRGERSVQALHAPRRMMLHLAQELLADGPEEPFDLPAALRPPRPRVDQPDPEQRARPQQLPGHER